jgi:hypothetical protein
MRQVLACCVCVQAPVWQASTVHARPSLAHAAPSGWVDHWVVLTAGRQAWQGVVGSTVLAA